MNTRRITELVEQIRPILANQGAEIQGGVLCDLLAIWLAGHHVEGDRERTRVLRHELLRNHLFHLEALVEVNAAMLGTTPSK